MKKEIITCIENHDSKDVFFFIRLLNKLMIKEGDNRIKKYGLTSKQGRILFFINHRISVHHQEVHQRDIEKEFHLSKSTVSGLVKRLENNGFINRINKSQFTIIQLSEKGEQFINQFKEHGDKLEKMIIGKTKDKELSKMGDKLKEMIKNLYKEEMGK